MTDGVDVGPTSPTSSLTSSSPPADFDINVVSSLESLPNDSPASSISIDSNQEFLASPILITDQNYIKCVVCERHRRLFYCSNCIHDGNFVNSHQNLPERFAEKKLKLLKIQEEAQQLEELFLQMHQETCNQELMQAKIRSLNSNCRHLNSLLDDEKKRLSQTQAKIKENEQALIGHEKSRKSKEGKLQLINNFIVTRKASIEKRQVEKSKSRDALKHLLHQRVYQLTTDIFPIEEINLDEYNGLGVNIETSPLLTFSHSTNQVASQSGYTIVEPWLPADGDYSLYVEWINEHKDLMPASLGQLGERNAAFRLSAGLAYLTQLVNKLANHLDVILPMRISFDTFISDLLTEAQFANNVAKLNTNVVHLTMSQGIDMSLLHPRRTINNLLLLLDPNVSNLGMNGPFDFDEGNEEVCRRIEDFLLPDLSLVTEDLSDPMKTSTYDDISDSEWELSDSISPVDMQSMLEQSAQQTTSIIGMPFRFLSSFWTK